MTNETTPDRKRQMNTTAAANHTPGPWAIDPKYLSEVQTPDDKTIASCWHAHAEGRTVSITGVLECSLEESAANARLIAAAPDMLAALKAVVMVADRDTDEFALARAAIAKAEAVS
ncbi:hypothetical protein [Mesorhizobium sp.]|uniref:hypothetical protein n=1 Tax=Mesorhizobium sp. TaxID=1871066 RepID=UPI000FE7DC54|nr:hypothetical protein [Mesorhizobium sp.]RWP64868.1 MAG: hypothetical protein EOR08_08110 [Mesorhizobium sp.]